MRRCATDAEAVLRLEQDAFKEVRECLNDDLNRVQIALEKAEAREQEAVADCLKVFKFKNKEGYEDGKRGVSLRYSLEIGSFLRS